MPLCKHIFIIETSFLIIDHMFELLTLLGEVSNNPLLIDKITKDYSSVFSVFVDSNSYIYIKLHNINTAQC